MTKIDIISGFLGAGKTTVIKKLIAEALNGEKLVLLENEFGEIGIDGGFMKDAGINVTEMNSGCICCSLVGDFNKALKMLIAEYSPERIIIEPSGVGKLSDVAAAVESVSNEADIEITSKTAVVDATKCKMYIKNFGEFFNNQIENASAIILSRTQKLNDEKLKETIELIKEHNPNAPIVTTPWEMLNGKQILDVMCGANKNLIDKHDEHHHEHSECHEHHHHEHDEHCKCHEHHHHEHDEHCECGCHDHEHHDHDHDHEHHHHHADDVFANFGFETTSKISKERLEEILALLSDSDKYGFVLRAKGILQTDTGEWIQFDFVPGEYEIREGSPDYTGRLCVIGTNIKKQEITELFGL